MEAAKGGGDSPQGAQKPRALGKQTRGRRGGDSEQDGLLRVSYE